MSAAATSGAPTAPGVEVAGLDLQARLAADLPELALPWHPTPVTDQHPEAEPSLVFLNRPLAADLGLDPDALAGPQGLAVLAGAAVPRGARPVAMAYAGHQFGGWSPRLGDGRALLLGELERPDGSLLDLHLKGSGRTPFARGGDGRGTLGSMLREVVVAEAMHALRVPTTRSLAVAATGVGVVREQGPQPGAVLTRTAASHLRVGTFQYAASLREPGLLARLVDHAASRHHPHVLELAPVDRPFALLSEVMDAQAALVARWMGLGFVHGVLNTDNVTISGETIDYGPCAFMDAHDPDTVYSSIDHGGRYAYGNQPRITHWNVVRLAESLLPAVADDEEGMAAAAERATELVATFPDRYAEAWTDELRAKLGLVEQREDDGQLAAELLDGLHAARADHTQAFRALADALRGDGAAWQQLAVVDPLVRWRERYDGRLGSEARDPHEAADAMDAVNPVYVPRNHLVEEALVAAVDGDMGPLERLMGVLRDPFTEREGLERHAEPAPASFDDAYRTFCGT